MIDKKIKIAYILPFYDEGTDTHLFYNYELIKRVAAQNNIALFVIIEKWSTSDVDHLGAPYYVQKFSFPPLRFLELVWKCFVLRVSGYRNFYVHYSYYGAFAAWLATWRPSRQVRIFYWNRGMPWLYKREWFEEKVFRFILRSTILVTGPESLAKEYQERYGVKEYRVLSNWVDVARFETCAQILQDTNIRVLANFSARPAAGGAVQGLAKLAPESLDKRVVLFVHHLSKRKGADLVPEIAQGFGDDVLFLMVGDGPEFENLKFKIENFKLNNVKLLGRVPNAEIIKYFWASDIFLMPSREEGSPHVLLEAMASGMPFVASNIGGVRELVPQGLEQFLCKSEDIKCFQNKIKTLLSDKALYDKAKTIGLSHAKNFDISRGVSEFTSLFK